MSKADPKHGRWILPLVIAGLVGFTFLFVNALPPGTVTPDNAAGDVTTTTAGDTENGGGAATTTVAPAVAAFLVVVDDFATRGANLAGEAQSINDDWDNDVAEFAATRDGLTGLQNRTSAFAAEVAATDVPPAAADAWINVTAAAEAMSTAAADMLTGLVDSSGPDDRLAGLQAYTTAAADLSTTLDLSRTAVGG